MTKQIGIVLFEHIEVLDFAGPYEVFTTASRVAGRLHPDQPPPFATHTLALSVEPVRARAGLAVLPDYSLTNHPPLDIVIVPGGVMDVISQDPAMLNWVRQQAAHAEVVASVCTGAFVLAQAGLLDGCTVTTHWEDGEDLQKHYPGLTVVQGPRWIDVGNRITSAGISAGMDMSLHIVERFAGRALAEGTARQMDVTWHENNLP